MYRPMLLPPLVMLAALAACSAEPARDPGPDTIAAPATVDTPAVDYLARIRAMPQGQRNAVFLRAIRDAGQQCQGITDLTEVTGPTAGGATSPATWSARCEDGTRWIVAIAPGGTATVLDQRRVGGAAKR